MGGVILVHIEFQLGHPKSDQATDQAEPWEIKVLQLCLKPQKITDIQELIGIKHRTYFIRNFLYPLLEKG